MLADIFFLDLCVQAGAQLSPKVLHFYTQKKASLTLKAKRFGLDPTIAQDIQSNCLWEREISFTPLKSWGKPAATSVPGATAHGRSVHAAAKYALFKFVINRVHSTHRLLELNNWNLSKVQWTVLCFKSFLKIQLYSELRIETQHCFSCFALLPFQESTTVAVWSTCCSQVSASLAIWSHIWNNTRLVYLSDR